MTIENSAKENLHQTALKAPSSSGVYLWRNQSGIVLYVGKAKNLKNRLSSYFSGQKDIKTQLLISRATSIEYITTANEYEAFILENNLIKKYNPRYNINLKDGKSYPVLKISHEKFPRLYKTRKIVHDGSQYFGPFPDATRLDLFIETLHKIYPLRRCKKFKTQKTPCLYFHIGACKAPCQQKISEQDYNKFIEEISSLLEKKGNETILKITQEMKISAKNLDFERAARLRDSLKALEILQKQNVVEDFEFFDRDYVALAREGELVCFTVLKIRGGKLLDCENFKTHNLNDDEQESIESFAAAYYDDAKKIPPTIYVSNELKFLPRLLHENFAVSAKVTAVNDFTKDSNRHKAALAMATQNAREELIRQRREIGDSTAMIELQKILSLKNLPRRIEGFDIAHIGGKFPIASLVSFWNGNPDKKNYRFFRLKTTDKIIDDFASMREATARRYTRLLNENSALPDLILIDGGIGQVNAVYGILKSLELEIPVIGLAKRDEEIWFPHTKNPLRLPRHSDALRLLQRVRDETHRFATTQNQKLRTKENTISIFARIKNVGKVREKILVKEFGTLKNFCLQTPEKISTTLKIPKQIAQQILDDAKNLLAGQEKSANLPKEKNYATNVTKDFLKVAEQAL